MPAKGLPDLSRNLTLWLTNGRRCARGAGQGRTDCAVAIDLRSEGGLASAGFARRKREGATGLPIGLHRKKR